MTVSFSPAFNLNQFSDEDGNPAAGYKIFQYIAGSFSVQEATYTTSLGNIANANPIVLDSSGQSSTAIWLTDGIAYNLVLTKPDGTTVVQNYDGVTGVVPPATGGGALVNIWNLVAGSPGFVNGSQFIIAGNQTVEFAVGNRVKCTLAGGPVYGTVTAVAFSSPNTQVTLSMDSTLLDASVSQAFWSALTASGRTVDAGGVGFVQALAYSNPLTVGGQIILAQAAFLLQSNRTDSVYKVWPSSGSGVNAAYTITPSPAIASYTVGQIFVVNFVGAGSGTCTININGLGPKVLSMYNSAGAKVDAVITANVVSQIAYDGTNFIYMDPIPSTNTSATALGHWSYSNAAAAAVSGNVNYQSSSGLETGVTSYSLGSVTVTNAGRYLVNGTASMSMGTSYFASMTLVIYVNGVPTTYQNIAQNFDNVANQSTVEVSGIVSLGAGSNVSIRANLGNGASVLSGFGTFTGIRIQ